MAPSAQDQPLIIMLPVSFPNFFAADDPSDQSHRRIHDERGEDHDWNPQLEYSVSNAENHQCPRQKSNRNAPRIAHEDTSGREIMGEKSQSAHRDERGDDEHDREMSLPPKIGEKSEPKKRHAACKAVHTVHKIIEIGHPEEDENAHRNRGDPKQDIRPTGYRNGRQGQADPADNDTGGDCLDTQPEGGGETDTVIDEGDDKDEEHGSHDPDTL